RAGGGGAGVVLQGAEQGVNWAHGSADLVAVDTVGDARAAAAVANQVEAFAVGHAPRGCHRGRHAAKEVGAGGGLVLGHDRVHGGQLGAAGVAVADPAAVESGGGVGQGAVGVYQEGGGANCGRRGRPPRCPV